MLGTGDREKKEEKTFCYYGGLKVKYPSLGPLHLNSWCTVVGTVCELRTIWQVETYFRKYDPWDCAWVQMQYDQQGFCSYHACLSHLQLCLPTMMDCISPELNVSINKLFVMSLLSKCLIRAKKVMETALADIGEAELWRKQVWAT